MKTTLLIVWHGLFKKVDGLLGMAISYGVNSIMKRESSRVQMADVLLSSSYFVQMIKAILTKW